MPRHHKSERADKATSRSSKSSRSRSSKAAEVESSPPKEKRSRSSKGKSSKKSRKEEVVESVPETVPETTETVPESAETQENDTPSRKKRTTPTKESVLEEFDATIDCIEKEIEALRSSSGKTKGIKFLRSLRKRVNTLRSHTARVMKKRNSSTRKNTGNSGFLKPVRISKEMAKFTGWDPDEKKSRVDVTKYICDYIKQHDLQNPEDRRQIRVEDDRKLKKLLGYDSKADDKPLTYYRLQSYMKKHFIKDEQK